MLSLVLVLNLLFTGIAGMNGTPRGPVITDDCLGGAQGSLVCMPAIVSDEDGGGTGRTR